MKWQDWLQIDIGALLRGRIEVNTPPPSPDGGRGRTRLGALVLLVAGTPGALLSACLKSFKGRAHVLRAVTEQLSRLVRCNAPLAPGLKALAADAPHSQARRVLCRLSDDVSSGLGLSEAMRRQPRQFPREYVDMVQIGEQTGTLDECLSAVSKDMDQRRRLWNSYAGLLSYFVILLTANLVVATFMIKYVAPIHRTELDEVRAGNPVTDYVPPLASSFIQIWGAGDEGPSKVTWDDLMRCHGAEYFRLALSRSKVIKWCSSLIDNVRSFVSRLFGVPNFVNYTAVNLIALVLVCVLLGLICAAAIFLLIIVIRFARNLGAGKLLAFCPVLRRLVGWSSGGRAADALSRLFRAGCVADEAFESVAGLGINPAYAAAFRRMARRIRQGQSIGDAAKEEGRVLPLSFREMLAIGESSGMLAEAMERIAHLYGLRRHKAARLMADVLLPAGVVVFGCITLLINGYVFSVNTAISDLLIANL